MNEYINKIDSSLLEIKAIKSYLKPIKSFKLISFDKSGKAKFLIANNVLSISYVDLSYAKLWTIAKYHLDGIKYEQVDVLIRSSKDFAIKYNCHFEDKGYSYLTCACYTFLNDKIVNGWQENRTVLCDELSDILYRADMNLNELVMLCDMKNKAIKKESLKDLSVLKLSK